MEVVRGSKIRFKYESQVDNLLDGISFSADDSCRVGLVGDNGCGKSTLLDIIRGKFKISGGELAIAKGTTFGYLPQEVRLDEDTITRDYLWQARGDLYEPKRRLSKIDTTTPEYADLIAQFYDAGGGEYDALIEKVLSGFYISEDKLDLPVSRLSGGEKTKVALARILLVEPDMMLLDEPTNHLEISSLLWLEEYLKSGSLPYIVISHDRRFLDNSVDEIWELHDRELTVYSGNYTFYKDAREQGIRQQFHSYEIQQKKIRQLKAAADQRRRDASKMDKFKLSRSVTKKGRICKRDDGSGRAGANSIGKMRAAKAVEKRIQLMLDKEKAEKPVLDRERKITIDGGDLKTPVVLHIEGIGKDFDGRIIIDGIYLNVENRTKLGIIGANGSGKSTLLKIITGSLDASSGSYRWAPKASIGYFSQEHENLDLSKTILDEVLQGRQKEQTRARTILGRMNIRRDRVHQRIGTLSLGERSKTALAKILFSDVNILVLDEPTNHMELSAREAFEGALEDYPGTLIFASHDRYLLDRVATHIFDIERNRLFEGCYSDYMSSI